MRVQFLEQIAEIERDRQLFKETPQFVRDYLGQWAVASNRLVYRYGAVRNGIEESAVPMSRIKAWVIGVDFGYDDPTAFAVGGWADYDPTLYIVREAPKRKTIEDEMAAIVAREDREGRAASVGEDDGDGDGEVWEDA